MTPEEKSHVLERLEERLVELEVQIKTLEEETEPVAPDVAIGRLSRMDSIEAREIKMATLRQAQGARSAIKRIIRQKDTPLFGVCIFCRQPIPVERLLAMPESNKCARCA